MDIIEVYQFFNIRQRLYALLESHIMQNEKEPCHVLNVVNSGVGMIGVEYFMGEDSNTKYTISLNLDDILGISHG